MPFWAVHREWGTLFAHLPELGCGRSWESIWRVRPRHRSCATSVDTRCMPSSPVRGVHQRRLSAWGVRLMDPGEVPVAVFDPISAGLRGEAFRLLAGLLLLFQANIARDQFLTTMRRTKGQPIDGFRTDICATAPADTQS